MKFRNLRITLSGLCIGLGVFVVLLWVRSYRYDKATQLHGEQHRQVSSSNRLFVVWSKLGAVHLCIARPPSSGPTWDLHFAAGRALGFGYLSQGESMALRMPYWFILGATILAAVFPWTPYFRLRYSMREMLVAVSVLAGLLGLLAYVARN